MPVRPVGSQAWATSTRSPPMTRQSLSIRTISISSGTRSPPGSGEPVPGASDGVEHVDVDRHVEGMLPELGQEPADDLHRVAGHVGREEVRPARSVLLARARPHADLVDALGRHRRPSRGPWPRRSCSARRGTPRGCPGGRRAGGCEVRKGRREHLDHRHGGRVVAAQHERDAARAATRRRSARGRRRAARAAGRPSGSSQSPMSASARSSRSRAERRRVRLDGVGGQPEVARAGVGALAEVHPAFEGDAVDDDPGLGERPLAGDEARRDRPHVRRDCRDRRLDEVLFGEQRDGRQRAADALAPCARRRRPLVSRMVSPRTRKASSSMARICALGLRPARQAVELHDDAVLGRVVGHGVADGGRHASRRASRW